MNILSDENIKTLIEHGPQILMAIGSVIGAIGGIVATVLAYKAKKTASVASTVATAAKATADQAWVDSRLAVKYVSKGEPISL